MLLHRTYDLQFDGYLAMRTNDITLCNSSESDEYCRTLMRREGLWETAARWVRKLSIEGWPDLLAGLVGKVVILEDEVRESFHIGPLLEAGAEHAKVHYFDGCGRLQEVQKVAYSRITSLQFGDRYSTIHAKYMSSDGQSASTAEPIRRPKRNR